LISHIVYNKQRQQDKQSDQRSSQSGADIVMMVERMGIERTRQVERISATSLVDQVADQLVLGIASGRIPRGERVIESDLAEDFGISRIPLREAMSVLESQGILLAEPRRGRRVAAFDETQVDEIGQARLALERVAVREARAAYRSQPKEAEQLDICLANLERAVRAPCDPTLVNQYDVEFHTEIYRASGNRYLQMMWGAIAKHVVIAFAVEQIFHRLSPADTFEQHQHLRDILLFGSEEDLDREIVAHIMSYGKGITELATKAPVAAKRSN
jgi:DNA-binding GntR family transcriptional regulator